jgi:hypothetical protein
MHPPAWHRTFPGGSLSRGRSLLRQIHRLGLVDVGADAIAERPAQPDFLSCGFVHIGVWGRRPGA